MSLAKVQELLDSVLAREKFIDGEIDHLNLSLSEALMREEKNEPYMDDLRRQLGVLEKQEAEMHNEKCKLQELREFLIKQPVAVAPAPRAVDEPVDAQEGGILAQAFRTVYHNTNRVKEFYKALNIVLGEATYARIAGLFQSSGWGKSRIILELWREGVWVIYLSFARGSRYPRRSTIADEFLYGAKAQLGSKGDITGQLNCMNYCLAYFIACMRELQKMKEGGTTQEAFAGMMSEGGGDFWTGVTERMSTLLKELAPLVPNAMKSTTRDGIYDFWEAEAGLKVHGWRSSSSLQLLFAFDEAKHLLEEGGSHPSQSVFIPVRRSTRAISQSKGVLSLFTDTSSEITNFSAPDWMDASDRLTGSRYKLAQPTMDASDRLTGGRYKLAPPIYATFTADCPEDFWEVSTSRFSDVASYNWSLRYGRPLWWSMYRVVHMEIGDDMDCDADYGDNATSMVYHLARDKLLGGRGSWARYIEADTQLSENCALAILGTWCGLHVDPASTLASALVAGNLLTTVAVSPGRDRVWTSWSVEPVVAEAAAEAMKQIILKKRAAQVFQPLDKALTAGWVDKGYKGELVARMLLLEAMGRARGKRRWCTVDDFCKSLVGQSLTELAQDSRLETFELKQLATAKLYFNAFRRIYKESLQLTGKDLVECYKRCCAVVCYSGTWGVDLWIPAFLGQENEEVTEQKMTILHGQVKLKEHDDGNVTLAKISPQFAGMEMGTALPFLSLYMNVGSRKKAVRLVNSSHVYERVKSSSQDPIRYAVDKVPGKEDKEVVKRWNSWLSAKRELQVIMVVKGLDAFGLDEDLKRLLMNLVEANRSPFYSAGDRLHSSLLKIQNEGLNAMFPVQRITDFS